MLHWSLIFLSVALVAEAFGFSGRGRRRESYSVDLLPKSAFPYTTEERLI